MKMIKGYVKRLYITIDGTSELLESQSVLLDEKVAISGPLVNFNTFEDLCSFIRKNSVPELYYIETPIKHTPIIRLGFYGDIGEGKITKDNFSHTSIDVYFDEFEPTLDFVINSKADVALKYIKERI